MRSWMSAGLILGFLTPALAQEVSVGRDCRITWTAPTHYSDGRPVTALKEHRLYVRPFDGQYDEGAPAQVIPAPTTETTCQAANIVTDGRYCTVVVAVDQAGKVSRPSQEVVFRRDTTLPEPPGALQVIPMEGTFEGTFTIRPRPEAPARKEPHQP